MAVGDEMNDQFAVYLVSSFSNLQDTLNKLAKNDDWDIFQVLPGHVRDDGYQEKGDRIILKAKKKKRGT